MVVFTGVISYPIPPYSNPPIEPQFYQPNRFVISAITLGRTTTVSTTLDMNYVVGQLVRLIIPPPFGSYQLNEIKGYVLSIPSSTQVVIDIDSSQNVNQFIADPYTATITGATQASNAVLTANNSFGGGLLTITGVEGMTELNGANRQILSRTSTTITLDLDSTLFGIYTSGGLATLQVPILGYPQILAIGDINFGGINGSGRVNLNTSVPGAFINISPS